MTPYYTYLWVRTDIPLADQIVQAAHAAQEAGARWGVPPNAHLVLLAAPNEEALRATQALCNMRNVPTHLFYEPDSVINGDPPMGQTALCTAPLPREARRLFRQFALWRH